MTVSRRVATLHYLEVFSMRTPVRFLSVAVTAVLACAVTAWSCATPAAAGPSQTAVIHEKGHGSTIPPSRYPSIDTVAGLFPDYRGGRRELLRGRQLSLTSVTCRGVDMASTQPRAGGSAIYNDRRGQSPYFTGGTSAAVGLYDFRKPKRAQAALEEERDTIRGCYGPNFDDYGYGTTYQRLAVPGLADDQFAYRQISHDVNTGNDWFVHVYFRQGRFLGVATLQRDRSAPSATAGFDLARAAVRASS